MPTLNLDENDGKEYQTFIKGISQQFTKFVPGKTPSLEEPGVSTRCKEVDNLIDECFEKRLEEGKDNVYQRMIEAKIEECFQNTDPGLEEGVRRTYLVEELLSKTKQPPINWVFQVSLIHDGVTLDILIQRYNLYLVGYKGKVKVQENDETKTVERWILLKGEYRDHVKSVILSQYTNLGELIEAKLDTSYLSLFSKSESGFTEEVRVERSRDLYNKLKVKLEKTKNQQAEVVKREEYAKKKLDELVDKRHVSSKNNLLAWMSNFVEALEANGKLEREGAKVRSLRNFFADEREKPKKRSRLHDHAEKKLKEMKLKWENEVQAETDPFRKQIESVDNLLDWLKKIEVAGTAGEAVDKDGKSKNLRIHLAGNLEKLQKESITAQKLIQKLENLGGTSEQTSVPDELVISWVKELEKEVEIWKKVENELDGGRKFKEQVPDVLEKKSDKKVQEELQTELDAVKKLEKAYSRMKNLGGTSEHTSVPEELLISWVMEFEKGVEILKNVENELEKKLDKKVQEELKTELEAVKKLVQKLEKRFSVEKESTQGMEGQDVKTETSHLKAVLKKQYSQVLIKDRLEFYQDLKRKADHLKAAMQVLHTDAYSTIVRKKTENLKLNREALRNAVKHLTTKPFDDDKDSAKHIIILIQMICEATRFGNIAKHISDNYMKPDAQTAPLSTEMIRLQHKWTETSSIITRGMYTRSEESSWEKAGLPIPEICPKFTVIRSRTEQQAMEE